MLLHQIGDNIRGLRALKLAFGKGVARFPDPLSMTNEPTPICDVFGEILEMLKLQW